MGTWCPITKPVRPQYFAAILACVAGAKRGRSGDRRVLPIQGDSAQKGYLFRLQVYKRVGTSRAEVHERVGKSVI